MAKLSGGLTEVVQRLNEKCKFSLFFFKKDVVSEKCKYKYKIYAAR